MVSGYINVIGCCCLPSWIRSFVGLSAGNASSRCWTENEKFSSSCDFITLNACQWSSIRCGRAGDPGALTCSVSRTTANYSPGFDTTEHARNLSNKRVSPVRWRKAVCPMSSCVAATDTVPVNPYVTAFCVSTYLHPYVPDENTAPRRARRLFP